MALPITIITALANLILGIVSYVKKSSNASHVLLTIFTFLIATWTFLNYLSISTESELLTLFWIRAVMLVTTPLIIVLYLFLITFPNSKLNLKRSKIFALIIITISICILNILPLTFKSVSIENGTITPEIGYGIIPFAILILWSFIAGLRNLTKRAKSYKGLQRAQIKMFLLGLILTFSSIIITNFVMVVLFQESSFVVFGPLFTLILTGFIFYSMVRHRFFGIRFVLGQGLSYLILGVYVYISFYLVTFVHNTLWGSIYKPYAYITGIFITVIFIYIYKIFNEGFSSGKFLKFLYLYNPIEARDTFINKVSSEIQLEKLLVTIVTELVRIFQIKNIGTILFDSNNHKVIYELYKGQIWKESPFSDKKRELLNLAQYWQDGHSPIIYVEEIDTYIKNDASKYKNILEKVRKIMRENNIEVIMPLNRRVKQNGFIFLGEKGNKDAYTTEDFELLESIIGFTGVAVQNSIAHKELQSNLEIIQDFNKTLQQRVSQATEELEEKIEALKEARRKERDMIDIMGHELRTPLSIIKVNLGLMQNKLDTNIYQKYVKRITESLEREILLLETMISSTKIDGQRMALHLEDVNIVQSIKHSLSTFTHEAKDKNIDLKFSEPKDNILVYADKVRLVEILDNLISNAVKYTAQGQVEVKIQKEQGYIRTLVIDTGPGIPHSEIKHLGKKFYRIDQYVNEKNTGIVRPGGTGLGLYVAFGLIELIGGTYQVESEEGKGSTFSFTIPLYTKQPKVEKNTYGVKNVFERLKMKK